MTNPQLPLEWLDACNHILDLYIEAQKSGPLTTPDIIEMFTEAGMDPDMKPIHVAALLATAIQRLAVAA
jgi:hypothetical protein